jgi:hypothetical protein
MYGQEVSEEAVREFPPGTAPCRLELYTLSGDRQRSEFSAEQRARWAVNTGASPAPGEAEANLPLTAVPLLLGVPVGLGWLKLQARLKRDGRLEQLPGQG